MTDRMLEVLKNPIVVGTCQCHLCKMAMKIDYPEWRKQVLAAVELNEQILGKVLGEYLFKIGVEEFPNPIARHLIANRERWLL